VDDEKVDIPDFVEGPTVTLPDPPRIADLVTANEAIRALGPFFGGRRATKELLIELLIDNEVRAYARYQWVTGKKSPRAVWKAGPPSDAARRAPIRGSIFTRGLDLPTDMKRWRWRRQTRLYVTLQGKRGQVERHFFQDVRFRKSDIVGITAEMTKFFRERYKGGRRFDEKRWRAFWVEFALLLRDRKIGPDQMKSVGAFQKFVWEAYVKTEPENPLDFVTVATALSEALSTLKENPPA
jgi:hypothetical protein